jgi:hypothetical protein
MKQFNTSSHFQPSAMNCSGDLDFALIFPSQLQLEDYIQGSIN